MNALRPHALPMHAVPKEKNVHCSRCDALCCRLTVVLFEEDSIPQHLTEFNPQGVRVMARDDDGWCVALDGAKMNCGIYDTRPTICRKFKMAGPYCLDVRAEARRAARPVDITLLR
jgi:Fe-S-cluster containining protein